jgi:hypothetical protein
VATEQVEAATVEDVVARIAVRLGELIRDDSGGCQDRLLFRATGDPANGSFEPTCWSEVKAQCELLVLRALACDPGSLSLPTGLPGDPHRKHHERAASG